MKSFYYQYEFNDFELLAETARAWQIECAQLDLGPISSSASQVINDTGITSHFFSNRTIKLSGTPPKDMWTLQLSTPATTPWLLGGREIAGNAITVYPPGYDFDCHFNAGYEAYSFSLTSESFYSLCDELEVPELADVLKTRDVILCPPETKMNLWQRAGEYSSLLKGMESPEGYANLTMWHDYERDLLRDILLALAEGTSTCIKSKFEKRSRVFIDINDYMEANPFDMLTVRDLCQITQVSERTLQYNFRSLLGITPKAYLKAISLNRVRKGLLKGLPENNCISDIANRWGFWHMGQFAADYRRMFGELPSKTLKKNDVDYKDICRN